MPPRTKKTRPPQDTGRHAPNAPTFQSDPVGWNRAQESVIDAHYFSGHSSSERRESVGRYAMDGVSDELLALLAESERTGNTRQRRKRDMAILQRDLTRRAMWEMGNNNLEENWLNASKVEKEKHMWEGLKKIISVDSEWENIRMHAPEVHLRRLIEDDGRPWLLLLNSVLLQDDPGDKDWIPAEPTLLTNPCVDEMLGLNRPGLSSLMKTHMLRLVENRNYFIFFFLWNTLLSFCGQEEKTFSVKSDDRGKISPETQKVMKDQFPEESKKWMAERKKGNDLCEKCDKPDFLLEDGQRLKRCGPCANIGRYVFYCSKECQTADWKSRHKKTCGKPHATTTAPAWLPSDPQPKNKSDDKAGIPPADPSFKRPAGLLYQIDCLRSNPDIDYILVGPQEHDFGMRITDPFGRIFFRILRNKAMKTGDKGAVVRMIEFLDKQRVEARMSKEQLLDQLEREYGKGVRKELNAFEKRLPGSKMGNLTEDEFSEVARSMGLE